MPGRKIPAGIQAPYVMHVNINHIPRKTDIKPEPIVIPNPSKPPIIVLITPPSDWKNKEASGLY